MFGRRRPPLSERGDSAETVPRTGPEGARSGATEFVGFEGPNRWASWTMKETNGIWVVSDNFHVSESECIHVYTGCYRHRIILQFDDIV